MRLLIEFLVVPIFLLAMSSGCQPILPSPDKPTTQKIQEVGNAYALNAATQAAAEKLAAAEARWQTEQVKLEAEVKSAQASADSASALARSATMPSDHPIVAANTVAVVPTIKVLGVMETVGWILMGLGFAACLVCVAAAIWTLNAWIVALVSLIWKCALPTGIAFDAVASLGLAITPFTFWRGIAEAVLALGIVIALVVLEWKNIKAKIDSVFKIQQAAHPEIAANVAASLTAAKPTPMPN